MTNRDLPWAGRQLHFVGIGGCGMSGLALLASHLGATVTGSDVKESIFIESLRADSSIRVAIGHDPKNVPADAEVVYSSAVGESNAERMHARERGQKELHRSSLIADLTRVRRTVAVAGAHGKTTTSALLAHVLTHAGKEPSYIVGGLMRPPAAHARAGASDILVIEADESDRSLLNYSVDVAVITNVDLDHVGDAGGFADRRDVARLLNTFSTNAQLVVTTPDAAAELDLADTSTVVVPAPQPATGSFVLDGLAYQLTLPGEHNVANGSLVVAAALHLGCTPAEVNDGLSSFPGLKRRFEFRGTMPSGARIFDDYAHHPAEVQAAIKAARTLTSGRVIAVFQPHLFSRTRQFAKEFADALSEADLAVLDAIYPAREAQEAFPAVTSDIIVQHVLGSDTAVSFPATAGDLVELVRENAESDDTIVLLIGAGDIGRLANSLRAAD